MQSWEYDVLLAVRCAPCVWSCDASTSIVKWWAQTATPPACVSRPAVVHDRRTARDGALREREVDRPGRAPSMPPSDASGDALDLHTGAISSLAEPRRRARCSCYQLGGRAEWTTALRFQGRSSSGARRRACAAPHPSMIDPRQQARRRLVAFRTCDMKMILGWLGRWVDVRTWTKESVSWLPRNWTLDSGVPPRGNLANRRGHVLKMTN